MNKAGAAIGSLAFLVIAPGFVAGVVPWWISRWEMEAAVMLPVRVAGIVLIALGIAGLLDSFARFALQGLGTPAPVAPTEHLVISGLYRNVRNPMYCAVTATILGQGLLFGNWNVLEYGAAVWLLFHLFVVIYEEPVLRRKYGSEYNEFCREVPRWIPRIRHG
jgi:protein-S-isoprenylcysteine O-methyltransferase Ste14